MKNLTDSQNEQIEEHDILLSMEGAQYAHEVQSQKAQPKRLEFVRKAFYAYENERRGRLLVFSASVSNLQQKLSQCLETKVITTVEIN